MADKITNNEISDSETDSIESPLNHDGGLRSIRDIIKDLSKANGVGAQ